MSILLSVSLSSPDAYPFRSQKSIGFSMSKNAQKFQKCTNLSKDLNIKNIVIQIEKSEYIHKLLNINNIQSKLLKLTHQ